MRYDMGGLWVGLKHLALLFKKMLVHSAVENAQQCFFLTNPTIVFLITFIYAHTARAYDTSNTKKT